MFLSSCQDTGGSVRTNNDLQSSKVVQEVYEKLNACDKLDAEQEITNEAIENVVQISDEIETANLQFIRCDGSVSHREKGPVRRLEFLIPFFTIDTLKEKVHFVEIKNQRTCSSHLISSQTKKQKIVEKPISLIELNEAQKEVAKDDQISFKSSLNEGGEFHIRVSDSNLKLKNYLNVKDGNNVIEVTYFGECKEYKNEQNREKGPETCLKAEILGKKRFLLHSKVIRPDETKKEYIFDTCDSQNQ